MMEERPDITPSFADALKKNIFELTDNENNNAVWGHIQKESKEDVIKGEEDAFVVSETLVDSRFFTLDSRQLLSTLDNCSRLSTITLDSRQLLSTLDNCSRLSTITLDSQHLLSTLDPRLLDTLYKMSTLMTIKNLFLVKS